MKNIKIEEDLWEALMKMKIENRSKNISEVIKELLQRSKK